jgi:ribosome recycling factor
MSDEVLKDFLDEAKARMQKSVDATKGEFATVRTGRASPHLLDRIDVDYYGTTTSLRQLTPYDKNSIKAIEKSILESDVGLTPSNDGQVIRLSIPELTEERRKELVKVVHGIAEQGRVAVRNVRRDVMHDLRELKSEGEVGSDQEHRAESELQKLTDSHVGDIDSALAGKEQEILEV